MANVALRGLTKRFGKVVAVEDMSLEVGDGEFLVLVGPSGCGKTTVLRCLAGLEEPEAGEIYIGGRLVNNIAPKDRDIAMVFQNYALYPHMNVYDNLSFGLRLRKLPKEEINKRVNRVAEMLGLSGLLQRKPRELSGGERQRVALGRAIVREPKVFLMDEPLSNLDAKLRVQMRAELIRLHRQLRTTTIYVTHDQVEAMTMGERIAVMKNGVIQQVDTPLGLYNNPANLFVAGFIGSPPMNFLPAKIVTYDNMIYVDGQSFLLKVNMKAQKLLLPYINKNIIFGIRPEHIYDKSISAIPGASISQDSTIRAVVDVIEPIGANVYLYLTCGQHSLVANIDAATKSKEGELIEVIVDMEKAHIFDPITEGAII